MKFKKSNYKTRKGRKHFGKRYKVTKKTVRRIAKAQVNRGKETYRVDRLLAASKFEPYGPYFIATTKAYQEVYWVMFDSLSLGNSTNYVKEVYEIPQIGTGLNSTSQELYKALDPVPILEGTKIIRRNIIIRVQVHPAIWQRGIFPNTGWTRYGPYALYGATPTLEYDFNSVISWQSVSVALEIYVVKKANRQVLDDDVITYLRTDFMNLQTYEFLNPTIVKVVKRKVLYQNQFKNQLSKEFMIKIPFKEKRKTLSMESNVDGTLKQTYPKEDKLFLVVRRIRYAVMNQSDDLVATTWFTYDPDFDIRVLYKEI